MDTEIYDHITTPTPALLDSCQPLRASDVAEVITFAMPTRQL